MSILSSGLKDEKGRLFTQDWFSGNIPNWKTLLDSLGTPDEAFRILEVGVFEGRSTCWLLENYCINPRSRITVIDTFSGGTEHSHLDLGNLRAVFEHNVRVTSPGASVEIHEGFSIIELSKLVAAGCSEPGYDFISVDASHRSPDVLADCVLAFQLLRRGGIMALDDYIWTLGPLENVDLLETPKLGIDAFTNIYRRHIRVIPGLPLYQLYLQKL